MEVETSEKKERDYVKFTAYLVKVLFPARFKGGDFAIVKFRLDEEQEGSVTEGFVPFADTELIVKGTFPELDYGVSYTVRAKEVVDPKYGKQYNLVGLHVDYDFNTREDQRKFLTVALGSHQADKIMEKIPNPVEAFKNKDYKLLSSVPGIKMKTAIRLVKKYEENADNSEAYVELYDFGLTKNAIDKLVINYKSPQNLIDKIKENPYILIDEVDGYGWARADAIALNSKIPPTSIFRLVAYAKYYLNTSALENGNTWIGLTELRNAYLKAIPEATDDDVRLALSELLKPIGLKPEIIMILQETKQTTEQRVALYKYYELEQNIAKELRRLLQGENIPYDKEQFEKNVRELEEIQGWSYTDEQIDASIKTLNNPVSIVTGAAGSGKTSAITLAAKTLSKHRIAQTALSGRAASRMSEITGLEGYTMHRLLGMRPGLPIPEKNALNPLDEDIVILDETSMVDGFMFLNLLRAIRTGAKLIMLGDINQLESIGLCNLLNDMIKSGVIPTSMLNKIHRQAEASGIITQSIRAKDAQSLIPYSGWTGREVRGELKDLEMVVVPGSEQIQVTLISEYMRLINENRLSVDDIDIIVPMRKRGEASLEVLNHKIQELVLNTKELQGVEIKNKNMYNGGYTLYETDKIIITKNAYDTISPMGEVVPVYNGNTGRIKKIDFEEDIITVELVQQGEVYIEKNQWNIINLGYAITCHAKQGSEVPFAVVGIDSSSYALMSREWLYTALTRAKKHCVLVAQNTVLQSTVKRSSISNKQTWLLEILTGENDAILPRV